MCGIAGVISLNNEEANLDEVLRVPFNRGPDFIGTHKFKGKDYSYDLAHTRLSIQDLSSAANQPFFSDDQSIIMLFNGEIYNCEHLKENFLKDENFQTTSDTEVILKLYTKFGIEFVKKLNGMFAIVLIDTNIESVFIFRDRFGIKPIYYSLVDEKILFASELKQFKKPGRLNKFAIKRYLIDGITDYSNSTFYKDIFAINPGSYLNFDLLKKTQLSETSWDTFQIKESQSNYFDSLTKFKKTFKSSIKRHLISDVPIASTLSGGMDSASIMAQISVFQKIESFTARNINKDLDESSIASNLARQFGNNINVVTPNPNSLQTDFWDFIQTADMPTITTSVYSQYCLYKNISEKGFKVCMSGQGSDELLCGYTNFYTNYLIETYKEFGFIELLRQIKLLRKKSRISYIKIFLYLLNGILPTYLQQKLRRIYGKSSIFQPWIKLSSNDYKKLKELIISTDSVNELSKSLLFGSNLQMLLRYEDRNSMRFGVESRVPFLDKELTDFSYNLPFHYKIYNGETKRILRDSFKDVLPTNIINDHKKKGFETPEYTFLISNRDFFMNIYNAYKQYLDEFVLLHEVDSLVYDFFNKNNKETRKVWWIINLISWLKVYNDTNN
ncbi:asparagine synthase (glutamine-hydrolyzing) [Gammaproteobacteria bacterium]|nr:asparagine synthase (glutamine-hydrolyzing) [Gammaproteobacteria bacterium]